MSTTVVKAYPPNYLAIARRLPVRGKPVIFAYGETIYDPTGRTMGPELVAHERVHCRRQLEYPGGVEPWWVRYLADVAFRLSEEIPAHRAEYHELARHVNSRVRTRYLETVAAKLSAPLYGNLITVQRAIEELLKS